MVNPWKELIFHLEQKALLFCLTPDLVPVFDAHIKLSRDFAKPFAEARSPIIYNCRTSR